MAFSWLQAERVRTALRTRTGFVERQMMGGVCFMVRDHMACGVFGYDLLVRTGEAGQPGALQQSHVRPMSAGNRRMRGFVIVAADGISTDQELEAWLVVSLTFVATLPDKRPTG